MVSIITNPSFVEKYLHIGVKSDLNKLFDYPKNKKSEPKNTKIGEIGLKVIDEITNYQTLYKLKLSDINLVKKYLSDIISSYINQYYDKINIKDADINYFMKGISSSYNEKFSTIVNKMDINHIIKMLDYTNEKNTENGTFKILMNMYFKLFGEKILLSKYGKTNKYLYEQINEDWSKINLDNLFNFANVLSKLKYNKIDTFEYDKLFQTKFDDIENINKIIDFVKKNYLQQKEQEETVSDINETCKENTKNDELKYKFRFILENIKSNGFILFEQYSKDVKTRYDTININMLNRDIKLVTHFIQIISSFEKTNVNRYVNDMLINIRNYLFDLEETYYNNETYRKIKIRAESDKYKNIDISKFNRDLTTFQTFKYNYYNNENILGFTHNLNTAETEKNTINYNTANKNLVAYLDIYRSFYKTRYPDREIEYDFIDSTIIVKIKFDSGIYYIHMALLQYIVLDRIMNQKEDDEDITASSLSEIFGLSLGKLNDTFNSLLKIKIIGRTNSSDIRFAFNKDFIFDQNKLSIADLVKKATETKASQREFIHDRNMIVFCNLVHYAKKNTYFSRDTIMEQLSYCVPFKLNDEYIDKAIEKAVEDEYIKLEEIPNANGITDIIYQYSDE